MRVVYSEFAKQELLDAIYFYELEYTDLGKEFKSEVSLLELNNSRNTDIIKVK